MYYRIERDHLTPPPDEHSYQGRALKTPGPYLPKSKRPYPVVLYCYDDDGELYYTIGCSCHEAAIEAFDWSMADSGCTFSRIALRGEKATPFIG